MDRLCALAVVAVDRALAGACIDPAAWQGERVATLVGTQFGCMATNEAYYRELLLQGASPRVFTYTLPSSPLGEVTIHFGARGPGETWVSGPLAGLEALGRAGRLCETGRSDLAIVIAVEAAPPSLVEMGFSLKDGAIALVVEPESSARQRGAPVLCSVSQVMSQDVLAPVLRPRRNAPVGSRNIPAGRVARRSRTLQVCHAPRALPPGRPGLPGWVHYASVGALGAVEPLLERLRLVCGDTVL